MIRQSPSVSNSPHPEPTVSIEFTTLPLRDIAVVLRQMAIRQVENLLDGKPPPDLAAMLPVELARIIAPAPTRKGPDLRQIVRQINHLSDVLWRARMVDHLRERFDGFPPQYVPDDLWALLGEMAWNDLAFRLQIAMRIEEHLAKVFLLLSDKKSGSVETPVAVLSVQVFWLLLALNDMQAPERRQPDSIVHAIGRLKREGQRQAQIEGWAGFWDQWIICKAVHCWKNGFQRMDAPTRAALLALPFLAQTYLSRPPAQAKSRAVTTAERPLKLASLGWQDQKPSWFTLPSKPATA